MDFTFIHAADLHIDSPLAALGRKNADAAEHFKQASRRAVEALVRETLESGAKFLIIAGDVFDGDWRDMSSGLFLVRELARLDKAGVRVFIIRGNHDAAGVVSKGLANWPANVTTFSARKAETFDIEELRVALHGRSFADRRAEADFIESYPARREGWLNIGILHTSLEGHPDHDPYAPCSQARLTSFGYDYWALGHIHERRILSQSPWIVYPGNLQGRSVKECGPKGAMRVQVRDGRVVSVEPVALDVARWAHPRLDISACQRQEDMFALVREAIDAAAREAEERPLALRITLHGACALHDALLAGFEQVFAEVQALAAQAGQGCWIEKIRLTTTMPARAQADDLELKAFDLDGLLGSMAQEEDMRRAMRELTADIKGKLPPELKDALPETDEDLSQLAMDAQHYLLGALGGSDSREI